MTREEILTQIYSDFIKPLCNEQGGEIANNVKISVGIPKGSEKTIGQCWATEAGSGYFHIFISPRIEKIEDATSILIHEAIHTLHMNHRKGFQKLGSNVGLLPPWTATTASETLKEKIKDYTQINRFDLLYHQPQLIPLNNKKKQSTRLIKITCSNPECGYIARTSREHIKKGLPTCVCGAHFTSDYEPEEEPEEETED